MTAVVAALLWWQWPALRQAAFIREMALATAWSGAIACAAVAIVVRWVKGLVTPRVAVALLIVVSVWRSLCRRLPVPSHAAESAGLSAAAAIDAIAADPTLFRVVGFGDSLPPNAAMAYGLADPRGYDGVAPRRYTDLLGRGSARPWRTRSISTAPCRSWTCST